MQQLVTRLCAEMWFAPSGGGDGGGDEVGRKRQGRRRAGHAWCAALRGVGPTPHRRPLKTVSPAIDPARRPQAGAGGVAQCASDLARVALAVYEAGGKAIHVPLPPDHHLISVVSAALASGGLKEEGAGAAGAARAAAALRKGAADVAGALLEQVVQLQGDGDGGSDGGAAGGERFGRLLALHALAGADPSLLVPPRDRQRFVRTLAPYASPEGDQGAKASPGERTSRGGAGGPPAAPVRANVLPAWPTPISPQTPPTPRHAPPSPRRVPPRGRGAAVPAGHPPGHRRPAARARRRGRGAACAGPRQHHLQAHVHAGGVGLRV
jgi:hypothetical protein